mmetsp:Transcript_38645/g.115424  ORF Transcript_38645/g.115424 Transcript_38645/m.115424 type:complete len:284 (-) Transcript_38645:1501-2352(-)
MPAPALHSLANPRRLPGLPPRGHGGGAPLGSATALGGKTLALLLELRHGGVRLGKGGVDAHAVVQVLLRATGLDGDAEALNHLPGVGPEDVHADDLLAAGEVDDDLHVALVIAPLAVEVPLQRDGGAVVDLHALRPQRLLRVLLAVADGAVLQRGEDRRSNIGVVHELRGAAKEPPREEAPGLNGDGGELGLAVNDVTNRVDVWHTRLFVVADQLAVALLDLQTGRLAVQPAGAAGAPHGHEDGVVDAKLGILNEDADLPRLRLLEPGWGRPTYKHNAVLLHV